MRLKVCTVCATNNMGLANCLNMDFRGLIRTYGVMQQSTQITKQTCLFLTSAKICLLSWHRLLYFRVMLRAAAKYMVLQLTIKQPKKIQNAFYLQGHILRWIWCKLSRPLGLMFFWCCWRAMCFVPSIVKAWPMPPNPAAFMSEHGSSL